LLAPSQDTGLPAAQNAEARDAAVKRAVIGLLLAGMTLPFVGALLLGVLREAPQTNSYAILADAWLHGRLHVERCFDGDCALFGNLTHVVFPPLPAAIVMPFVALFGPDFHFFMPLTLLVFAGCGVLCWMIARRETGSLEMTSLITLTLLFTTPMAFVALRGDYIWFFAQIWAVLFCMAALYAAMISRNALLAGLFIGMAFLCRQMAILYLPFLYVLLLNRDTPWWRIDRAAIRRALSLAAFPLAALAVYFAYNYARFGSPLETGYSYIFPAALGEGPPDAQFLRDRVRELGIFSPSYFVFNFVYMFIAGPHVEFGGRYLTEIVGFDIKGASPFLVAPILLCAFLGRWDRSFWFGLGTCALIIGITLFYHSNGFSQHSAQRYALDWLPILIIFLARSIKPAYAAPLSIMTLYSMAVTFSMIAVTRLY
jgi:hypothetical protein